MGDRLQRVRRRPQLHGRLSAPSKFVAITAVPEPSTCIMALAGLACGGCLRSTECLRNLVPGGRNHRAAHRCRHRSKVGSYREPPSDTQRLHDAAAISSPQ
ncbi:MAG: PEP-CTERM sorting domain-containing protein [Planctomycetia bacterium]